MNTIQRYLGLVVFSVLICPLFATAAFGADETSSAPFKPGVWKTFVYEEAQMTNAPIVFSGWAKADAKKVMDFCIWLDVYYHNGEKTFGRCAYFDREQKGWQQARGVFRPPYPVKRIVVNALFRGTEWNRKAKADGTCVFRDFKLERRMGTNETFVLTSYSNRPFENTLVEFTDTFDGDRVKRSIRTVPHADQMTSPLPNGCPRVWASHSMRKITPLTFPQGTDEESRISIRMARNERESAQVLVSMPADLEWTACELDLPTLKLVDGTPLAGDLKWERQGYLAREPGFTPHPCAIPDAERWFPELLLPAAPMRVRACSTQGAWITVYAASNAVPGVYRGEIAVKEKGEVKSRIPLAVTVAPVTIPHRFTMPNAFALMDCNTRRAYGADWKKFRREAQDIMLDHRLNPDDISRTELPEIEDLLHARERGMNCFNLLNVVPKPKKPTTMVLICKPEEVFNEKYYEYFFGKVKPFVEELKKYGLEKDAYVYGFDERGPEFYEGIRTFWERMQKEIPGIPLMNTAKNYKNYVSGKRKGDESLLMGDWYCPVLWDHDFAVSEEIRRKTGKKVWWYTCCGPRFCDYESNPVERRIFGLETWQVKADGYLYWMVNYWNRPGRFSESDTYFPDFKTGHAAGHAGGGWLMFPGEQHVLPSIRLAQIRDGMEDYEYAVMHDRAFGREATMQIIEQVSKFPGTGNLPGKDGPYDADPRTLDRVRQEMLTRLTSAQLPQSDDQLRFMWFTHHGVYDQLKATGFNCIIENPYCDGFWKLTNELDRAGLSNWLKQLEADGVSYILQCPWGHAAEEIKKFPRTRRDGTGAPRTINAANPAFVELTKTRATELAAAVATMPRSLIGVQTATEIRDTSVPSLDAAASNAYFKATGRTIPEGVDGRAAPHWSKLADFPKDRLVDESYPLYAYYRWFWKRGDGWNDYHSLVRGQFAEAFGTRPFFSMYDPGQRTPPMWGSGGDVSVINEWTYLNDDPCRVAYVTSEQQAMARGTGKRVFSMIQAFGWRRQMMGPDKEATTVPQWSKDWPNTKWPTMPPDTVQEGLWWLFSRQIDGIGFHGWNALFDGRPFGQKMTAESYAFTHPETQKVVSNLFNTVAIPFGPLFKAAAERAPDVALLESEASALFGGEPAWDWRGAPFACGVTAMKAKLSPYVIYEDEIVTRGIPASVKVLLMPKCEVLTRGAFAVIADFQRRGGKIVADDALVPGLKADGRLSDSPVELGRTVAAFLKPFVTSDQPDILVHARQAGSAQLVFAINDKREFGDYTGPWKHMREVGQPNAGAVSVAFKAGAVYDLVRHEAIPFEAADDVTRVKVDFTTNDGRAFLFCAQPLAPLTVKREGEQVVVTTSDADVLLPIAVCAEGAKPVYGVLRNGRWSGSVPTGAFKVQNLASGAWSRL